MLVEHSTSRNYKVNLKKNQIEINKQKLFSREILKTKPLFVLFP